MIISSPLFELVVIPLVSAQLLPPFLEVPLSSVLLSEVLERYESVFVTAL